MPPKHTLTVILLIFVEHLITLGLFSASAFCVDDDPAN